MQDLSRAAEAAIPSIQMPINEPVRDYAPGSAERAAIERALADMVDQEVDIPLQIGGRVVRTGDTHDVTMPHDHHHRLGVAHRASDKEVRDAIESACAARHDWAGLSFRERAAVFSKAADLLAGPWRDRLNAATMLGQSKTVYQAEIDSAAELIDFWRFNVAYAQRIFSEQPISSPNISNRLDYRSLEGFVYAITPFNFTAIAGNLPTAPALMGNCVLWKPSDKAMLSAHLTLELLKEAGLPDGVINLVNGDAAMITESALSDSRLAGIHYTGSTSVFQSIWAAVGARLGSYRTFPRIVGETGGKNFILAHSTADEEGLVTAILRGGYEYQGQKCSAASRVYVPISLWSRVQDRLAEEMASIKMGDVRDFSNFMSAVIDETAWTRLSKAIERGRSTNGTRLLAGGQTSRETGWYVRPTFFEVTDFDSPLLHEELFGPVVAAVPYADDKFDDIITQLDGGTSYGLTGSIFARDRAAINRATSSLRDAVGNFYVNDKPTGAVVGQQPFGGARLSGTNDKAGSMWNLSRWVSPRSIKETFVTPRDYRYPFQG